MPEVLTPSRRRIGREDAYSFDPPTRDPGKSLIAGVGNSTLAQIVKAGCQFGSVLILSRLLTPADFGLVAMAGPVYGFLFLFQDLGLGLATIQRPHLSHADVNFFFWINVLLGAILAVVLIAISPAIGRYYGEARLIPVVAAMALPTLLASIGMQSGAILTRRMQFGLLAINGAIGAVAGLVVSVIAALTLKNYWALYCGTVAGTGIPALGAVVVAKWWPTAPRRGTDTGAMMKFGGGVTLSNVSHFVARNADNVLIGWRWGEQPLGLYDRAYKLLLFPLQFIVGPTMYAMAPVLSRLVDDRNRYRTLFLSAVAQLILVVWPGIIWAAVFGPELVPRLLGAQWAPSSPIFQALAVAGVLQVLNGAPIPLFVSQGRTTELAKWGVFNAATCVIAFVLGLKFGVVAVAASYAASECIRTPILWWYVCRTGPVQLRDAVRRLGPHLVAAACCAALAALVHSSVRIPPALGSEYLVLILGLITAYVVNTAVLALFPSGRSTLRSAVAHCLGIAARFGARGATRNIA